MSKENLSSLLDDMLDDSAINLAADEVREIEAREAAQKKRAVEALRSRAKEAREAVRLEDIDELTGLTEEDLQKVLGKSSPDDLLVLMATAGDVLQRRLVSNLSEESLKWLRQNLEHMELVRDAERDSARAKVLKVANKLLDEGAITVPEAESVGAAAAPTAAAKELRDLLTELVHIAEQSGTEALSQLAESAGEPLLRDGLHLVVSGRTGDDLRRELAGIRAQLEKRYGMRLLMMEEALVSIGEKETAEAFRARLFED